MLSQTAQYALRAIVFLARKQEATPLRVGELARALGAPQNYLSKVLHQLAREGVLLSERGPAGGFRLGVDPGALRLSRIVKVFDPPPERRRCVLGLTRCSDAQPCPAHAQWREVAERAAAFFQNTTVADLLATPE